MAKKTLDSDHLVLFWSSKRVPRYVAEQAFDSVGMANLLPKVDHYGALHRAASSIVATHGHKDWGKVKFMGLAGKADAVGCEVREFLPGATRNELPFLFSLGVLRQADKSYAVELLDVDAARCPQIVKNKRRIERDADQYWRNECGFISANDLTNAITGLVKSSHGWLQREEGVVWAMPVESVGNYDTVADALAEHGVVMQTIRFDPVVNEGFVRHMCSELERRSMAVFNGIIEDVEDMRQRGAKPRSNGQQTRLEQWIAAEECMQKNKSLLGKAFARVAKAAMVAREKIGAEALKAFAG
jgi:hypothetical protein